MHDSVRLVSLMASFNLKFKDRSLRRMSSGTATCNFGRSKVPASEAFFPLPSLVKPHTTFACSTYLPTGIIQFSVRLCVAQKT